MVLEEMLAKPLTAAYLVEMPLSCVAGVLASGLVHPSHIQELCYQVNKALPAHSMQTR